MRIELRAGDPVLKRYENAIGALGEYEARRVMVRALNRAGMPTYTQVVRALRDQTSAPVKVIKTQVRAQRAWAGTERGGGKLEFTIVATGRPLPLKVFGPRETEFGVRVKVWGKRETYDGTFLRGGEWPDRVDLNLGGHVFHRVGGSRLPIEKTYGPSLPKELVEGKSAAAFDRAAHRLAADVAHEMGRVLPD